MKQVTSVRPTVMAGLGPAIHADARSKSEHNDLASLEEPYGNGRAVGLLGEFVWYRKRIEPGVIEQV